MTERGGEGGTTERARRDRERAWVRGKGREGGFRKKGGGGERLVSVRNASESVE